MITKQRFREATAERALNFYHHFYQSIVFPLISRAYPTENGGSNRAHDNAMQLLESLDEKQWAQTILGLLNEWLLPKEKVAVGGTELSSPLILAAGWEKGKGFETESDAFASLSRGENLIPGWRTMTHFVGPIEFGSYTRFPRLGNSGTTMWRDEETLSGQNRVGLTNPGSLAAAEFMAENLEEMPPEFGINIALSPGIEDLSEEKRHVLESLEAFLSKKVYPSWFTLNISCPNTEDDPTGNQTENKIRVLCQAAVSRLREYADIVGREIPLWVKVGPDLSEEQYRIILKIFNEAGVKAVVATNTLSGPTPDGTATAGFSGGLLHPKSIETTALLAEEIVRERYDLDLIGCGGVRDKDTYLSFSHSDDMKATVKARQMLTSLLYDGPWSAAWIMTEVSRSR